MYLTLITITLKVDDDLVCQRPPGLACAPVTPPRHEHVHVRIHSPALLAPANCGRTTMTSQQRVHDRCLSTNRVVEAAHTGQISTAESALTRAALGLATARLIWLSGSASEPQNWWGAVNPPGAKPMPRPTPPSYLLLHALIGVTRTVCACSSSSCPIGGGTMSSPPSSGVSASPAHSSSAPQH